MHALRRFVQFGVLALLSVGGIAPIAAQVDGARQIAAAIDSIAESALRQGPAAGLTVAVVRGGDTLVLRGYGELDRERRLPTQADAVYPIGSVTKQFTAAAILQLADQGKLSLEDEVTKFLPEYPTHGHRVTLRHLLEHTSGIQDYAAAPGFSRLVRHSATPGVVIAHFAPKPFDFAPGTAMVYSNSGYLLLGQVIERVSGMRYTDYVRTRLFEPAGMRSSHYCGEPIDALRARGYATGARGLRPTPLISYDWAHSAGALCSTVGDLVAWNRALHRGQILSPAAYRELTTRARLADGTSTRYARGIVVDAAFGRSVFYHGGRVPGYQSELRYFPDDSLSIAVLINTLPGAAAHEVAESIARSVYGDSATQTSPVPASLADYEGVYTGPGRGGSTTVRVKLDRARSRLIIHGAGPKPIVVAYVGNDSFRGDDRAFTFRRTGGRVTALQAEQVYEHSILVRKS